MTTVDDRPVDLDHLLEGNQRFRVGSSEHCADRTVRRMQHLETQRPVAAVLSCADARVDPDLVFDVGLGDLFSVRVAGSIASAEAIASLRYAVDQLGVRTVIVLGHEGCGAVAAAVATMDPGLEPVVGPIRRALDAGDASNPERTNTCAQAAAVRAALPGHVDVVAAIYRPATGDVVVHDALVHVPHDSPPPPRKAP
jgi:carbonic anhydrase